MRPPFWEVSLFSLDDCGQPLMIESIACFNDHAAMCRYVLEMRVRHPTLQIVTRHRGRDASELRQKNKTNTEPPFRSSVFSARSSP